MEKFQSEKEQQLQKVKSNKRTYSHTHTHIYILNNLSDAIVPFITKVEITFSCNHLQIKQTTSLTL